MKSLSWSETESSIYLILLHGPIQVLHFTVRNQLYMLQKREKNDRFGKTSLSQNLVPFSSLEHHEKKKCPSAVALLEPALTVV